MMAPLSLANLLTVVMAVICLWTIAPQSRGGVVKLWRLAIPPILAVVVALMLLAGVLEPSLANDLLWLIAAFVGSVVGRSRGWLAAMQADRTWRLVRMRPAIGGPVAALALVVLCLIDFVSAALEQALMEPNIIAAAAAFCAGYLGGRALAVAVRAGRAPHVALHDAGGTSTHGA